ncbi:MAG: hypothetical protein AMJ91_03575 [candidate division Zixibacteria bacterium SM23_73_3]|nr:MAG: hypothetical protein AMJ91_03575 [candidate division Zixibacteria bacterium SM23_73_3]
MKGKVKIYNATRIEKDKRKELSEKVAEEAVLRIFLNEQEIVVLSCTPYDQTYLAVGFLISDGFLKSKEEIRNINTSEDRVTVYTDSSYKIPETSQLQGILTSGCGKGKSFANWEEIDPLEDVLIDLDFSLSPDQILEVMSQFEKRSELFRETAGVHSAALAKKDGIILFNEDIGRHNAVDKVLGESLLKGIKLKDKFLVISGRVSSDIVSKLKHSGLSTVVSRTAPTGLAVRMAQKLGITLVGFVRGSRMTVYSFPVRIQ